MALEEMIGLPSDWDTVAGPTPRVLRRPWLTYQPARLPGKLTTFRVERDDRTMLASVGSVVQTPGIRRFTDPYRLLKEGHPFAEDNETPWAEAEIEDVLPATVLVAPEYAIGLAGPDAADDAAVDQFVADLVARSRDQGRRSVVALYLGPEAVGLTRGLRRGGFGFVDAGAQMVLPVTWNDMEGYLEALPGRKPRRTVRHEIRAFEESGLESRVGSLVGQEEEIVALLIQHARRHATPQTPSEAEALVDRLVACFGAERCLVFGAYDADDLVAFSLFVLEGDEWVNVLVGSDYEAKLRAFAHFHCMFYEPALSAPACGVKLLSYGIGDQRTKQRRGCRPVSLTSAYLRLDGG